VRVEEETHALGEVVAQAVLVRSVTPDPIRTADAFSVLPGERP
jgi:hypothetical protein